MAKTVRDARLDTRTARARLPQSNKPQWRSIDRGLHLGYRRGKRGGTWQARMFDDGRYREAKIGLADDVQDADGEAVLSFSDAQAKAREWYVRQQTSDVDRSELQKYTVADVMADYLEWFEKHRKGAKSLRSIIDAHINPMIGSIEAKKLTTEQIQGFHEKLASTPARRRSKRGGPLNFRPAPEDKEQSEDEARARRVTANRILTVLKAALTRAWRTKDIGSSERWRRVEPFRGVEEGRVRFLSDDECRRLCGNCPDDFRSLVQAAILTGCRYGELVKMQVRDFDPHGPCLQVRSITAKSGRSRRVALTDEGAALFKALTKERIGAALVFTHADGREWGKSHQFRPLIDACRAAKIEPEVSFHILRHTYASHLALNGTPLQVIAKQLGHSDTRMVEKHYAHLLPNYVADTVRKNFPALGLG